MRVVLAAAAFTLASAEPNCFPFCDNPCATLNGNHEYECGGCAASVLCHRGADGWREEEPRVPGLRSRVEQDRPINIERCGCSG